MSEPILLGWREWLSLPELGISAIRAKIDTGARSSALHVEMLETFEHDGTPWARFSVLADHGTHPQLAQAPILDRRDVTDSGGHTTHRIFIRSTLAIAGHAYPIDINLTDRHNMLFPMLLGRTALERRFVVDPGRSWLHGDRGEGGDRQQDGRA